MSFPLRGNLIDVIMQEYYKFPNGGYDVRIYRKQDILDCIDDNILDKEVALAIVEKCEEDCAKFLMQGRWAAIPHIGNIRIPKAKQAFLSEEQQSMIKEAYENLSSEAYIMFRKQLNKYNAANARFEKSYNYIVSMMANRYSRYYNYLTRNKGTLYARLIMYTCLHFEIVGGEKDDF